HEVVDADVARAVERGGAADARRHPGGGDRDGQIERDVGGGGHDRLPDGIRGPIRPRLRQPRVRSVLPRVAPRQQTSCPPGSCPRAPRSATVGTVSPRLALLALALAPVLPAAGCSSDPPLGGPVPGGNPPGAACSTAADCYCWQCVCEGLSGAPGEVQLC